MKKSALLCLVIGAVAASGAFAAGDPVAGKKKAFMCAGCHGAPGYRAGYPEIFAEPKLGGQHADYIVNALQQYKNGERNFGTMQNTAKALSDQDMADIAAYYAAQ
jgi:cytochrome c553